MWMVIGVILAGVGVWLMFSHDHKIHSKFAFAVPALLVAGIMMIINGMSQDRGTTYWLGGSVIITLVAAVVFAGGMYLLLRKITAKFRLNHPTPRDREKSF